ncbi:MAG: GNAT family N-acetyltransferase [Angustibacter sp.]
MARARPVRGPETDVPTMNPGQPAAVAAWPERYETLSADGVPFEISTASTVTREELTELFANASDRSLYQRFLGAGHPAVEAYVEQLLDPERRLDAVVARLHHELVAVASSHVLTDGEAEIGMLVADDHQHRGIGTLLLEDLVARARARGLAGVTAFVLSANDQMVQVLRDSGLVREALTDADTVTFRIPLQESGSGAAETGRRALASSVKSLARLLAPQSVVVVGAGRRRNGVGHQVVAHLRQARFAGPLYVVNRSGHAVHSVPAYRSVTDLPRSIDLGVVAVPAPEVEAVVRDLLALGIGALLVLSAGFGHATEQGSPDGEERLRDLCRDAGVRLLGPNCIGLVNTDRSVRLDASFLPKAPRPGAVAVISQSGAVAAGLVEMLDRRGLGVSVLATLGDAPDVGPAELLAYATEDAETSVVALHLEGLADPSALARVAQEATTRKPVLLLKPGHSVAARVAARSHTGAAAVDDAAVDALCRRTGITRVGSLEELADIATLHATQRAPRGLRVAVVGNSGGPGVLAIDALSENGLVAAELTQHTLMRLDLLLPPGASSGQLVDTTASAGADVLEQAMSTVMDDPGVDAVLLALTPLQQLPTALIRSVVDRTSASHPDVTTVLCITGEGGRESGRVPWFDDPARAVRTLAGQARWGAWVRQQAQARPLAEPVPRADAATAREVVRGALLRRPEGCWLEPREVRDLLRAYHVDLVPTVEADSPENAADASATLRAPLALKAFGESLVHKAARGAVALDLRSAHDVRDAAHEMVERLGEEVRGFVVQPMVFGRREVIIGGTRKPGWGPLVMVGRGGVDTDVDPDRAWALAPTPMAEVEAMVRSLRSADAIIGSAASVGSGRLYELVSRVSELVTDLADVAELDLNPVLVGSGPPLVIDARVRVAPPAEVPWGPAVRHLSP